MDPDEISKSFQSLQIPKTHATVGISNLISSNKQVRSLFVNRRLPDSGWTDIQIQSLLFLLSTLDTNNKSLATYGDNNTEDGGGGSRWCGVGEREGRVFSSLVAHRHYGLSHGMGRSGDITEPQPKAVGSSVLVKLTLLLTLDAIRRGSGLNAKTAANHGILLPMCTGMSMALVLSSLRQMAAAAAATTTTADDATAASAATAAAAKRNIVLWSRIDQKSCFKAIGSAGLTCVVIPTKQNGDEVITDLDALQSALDRYGDSVLAVITTTSCFAPRVPDHVDNVAKLCATAKVYHVINNAYGLQCGITSKLINRACVVGRVDAIVCSTDKNFLVPVGGAIVLSPDKAVVESVGKVYAGRASSSPIVDLFITLLSMGLNGYKRLLSERQDLLKTFPQQLAEVAEKHGERLLSCPSNTISFGITLDGLARPKRDDEEESVYLQSIDKDISSLGAMLFSRCVSGTRVIPRGQRKKMGSEELIGFGSSVEGYDFAYMTAACAIGVSRVEITEFFHRLDKTLTEFKTKGKKSK